jgi:hypothetical protein
VPYDKDDPISQWSDLKHKSVYSIDGRKLGFLRKVVSDYMFVSSGFISLTKYFIPIALAESISKKGITLSITSYEARSKYSYSKMKNTLTSMGIMPKTVVKHRPLYDRFLTVRYKATRNRLAAASAFVSGTLFLISGYHANLEIYHIIGDQIAMHTPKELWTFILAPVGILAFMAQLGGIAVLMGAALFILNRVNIAKFLVIIGTGQGIFTIGLRMMSELLSGKLLLIENNYIIWLTSSAVGFGILFAVISQSISKGESESIASKALKFVLRKGKNEPNGRMDSQQ